jgi:hypothetical protein
MYHINLFVTVAFGPSRDMPRLGFYITRLKRIGMPIGLYYRDTIRAMEYKECSRNERDVLRLKVYNR